MKKLEKIQPGQPITAALVNQLIEGFNQLQGLQVSAPLQLHRLQSGLQLGMDRLPASARLFEIIVLEDWVLPGGTSNPENTPIWGAKKVVLDENGDYVVDPAGGFTTHRLYDPLRVFSLDGLNQQRRQSAYYNSTTRRWELLPSVVGDRFAVAQSRWINDSIMPYVMCHPCTTMQGHGVDTSTWLTVYLPRLPGRHPNVQAGNIISYQQMGNRFDRSSLICTSNYLDDALHTVKAWIGNTNFPTGQGWALANGVDNAVSKGGSGRDLQGRFLVGQSASDWDYAAVGLTGGSKTHAHTLPNGNWPREDPAGMSFVQPAFTTSTEDHRPPWICVRWIERVP